MPVTWARPSTVIGAAGPDGAVGCPEVLMGPVVDWTGAGVGCWVACASEETAKTVPVIRSEIPRRMSFLPVRSFESKNCSLHVYGCVAYKNGPKCCATAMD